MEKAKYEFPGWVSTKISKFYAEQGIKQLFEWQTKILNENDRNQTRNLVFSAPTSAGKSLVAELLAWRVASEGKKVLFVLPYISVAREKLHQIQKCWRRDDLPVCGFIGPQAANPSEWVGAVCTIEKAASLVNRALSEEWFGDIGMIVVDEMHMLFDSSRGAHIEHMLSKVLLWNRTSSESERVRILGMSATIPELQRIGEWLDARVFEAKFRPISLENHIVIGTEMRNIGEDQRMIRDFSDDPLLSLSEESFRGDSQTLIMVSSKMEAEKVAVSIAMRLHELRKSDETLMKILKRRAEGLLFTKNGLERNGCKDRNVIGALAWGVAFHHAGLTMEERECIELGFREKSVIILVATSTLASGVNLPAERVIIKAQTRGPSALSALSYRQMVGRAGRTGHATRGESFLLVKKCDREAVEKILADPIDRTKIRASRDSGRTNIGRFILEGICTGLTTSRSQIFQLCSLLLFDSEHLSRCDLAITSLLENSFVSVSVSPEDEELEVLSPTQLGRAAIASSLPPEAALAIFDDLNVASRAIALDTELHMLYLVTPINVSVWQECDWHHLFALFTKLPPDHRRIANLVGVSERFILAQLQGAPRIDDVLLQVHTRFFSSLALFDLINEASVYEVSRKYRISRGCLQTLQSQSATYAAMIVAFCVRLGWTYLKALLDGFAMRLMFGIRSELSELVQIEGIDGQRARILHEKGITCVSHLSSCDASKLGHYLTLAVPYSSSNSNDGLGEWLFGEPRLRLDEAARCLKERARVALARRIQELGMRMEMVKQEEEKESQESCDSGLPDEEADLAEMTKSVTEMTLRSDESSEDVALLELEDIKKEEEEEEVEDTVIECLETSLLKMRAPKDENFLRRLSQTFSPVGIRRSFLNDDREDDSFDRPVPGAVPWTGATLRTPQRILTFHERKMKNSPYFEEDSFDRPVPGSIRKSILKKEEEMSRRDSINSLASENRSFDVFATPPIKEEKPRIGLKHSRIDDFRLDSPYTSSPLLKHPKLEPNEFRLEMDVCGSVSKWDFWLKSTSSGSWCSISLLRDASGLVVHTEIQTVLVPLLENSDIVIPLKLRIEGLQRILESAEVYIFSMEEAFLIFERFRIQIKSRPMILKFLAHLNNSIDCEAGSESEEDVFEILLKNTRENWPIEINSAYSESSGNVIERTGIKAFAMRKMFGSLFQSAILESSPESVNLEICSSRSVLNMFYAGISFDAPTCHLLVRTLRERIERLEEQIWRLAHGKFNLESPHEVSNVLFHRLGLVFPESSSFGGAKKKPRHLPTNKTILEQMTSQHPIVEKILEYRHFQHTVSQCLLPLEKYGARIHCWFEMCTTTGRILTNRPNLQNVPKRVSSDGSSARRLFRAAPGMMLIGADYRQLELRVLAHLSADEKLTSLIAEDRDLFAELSEEWSFPRDAVKQLCYGLIYGMGARSLAELTRMKVEEAEKMLRSFFSMFPGVRSYINETKGKDQVETILGRKRVMESSVIGEELARIERSAVNYTIQGSASEIFKTAIVSIEEAIAKFDARIVLTIHDEVLVECPIDNVRGASEEIRECMQGSLQGLLRVPMRVSLKTGSSWAELK